MGSTHYSQLTQPMQLLLYSSLILSEWVHESTALLVASDIEFRFMCSSQSRIRKKQRICEKRFLFWSLTNNARGPFVRMDECGAFILWHSVKTKNTQMKAFTHSLALSARLDMRLFPYFDFLLHATGLVQCRRVYVCRFEYINCVCVNEYNKIRRQHRPDTYSWKIARNAIHARGYRSRHAEGKATTEWESVCIDGAEATVNDNKSLSRFDPKFIYF